MCLGNAKVSPISLDPSLLKITAKELGSEGSGEPVEGFSAHHVNVAMQQDSIPGTPLKLSCTTSSLMQKVVEP